MSPEQARRRNIAVDNRTDVYSLGATAARIDPQAERELEGQVLFSTFVGGSGVAVGRRVVACVRR